MKKFWNFFLDNKNFSYIIVVALVIFGFISLITIPKESAPEVQVPVAIVSTVYPGASALDIEKLITNKIEEQLNNNLENVSKITSSSRDGLSSVVVEFNAKADIDNSVRSTKDEVDKVKSDLPSDANDPFVSEVNFVDQPIMSVEIISDLDDLELTRLLDDVESEIKKVQGISKVVASGLPEREAQVIVNKESLAQFNISILDVVNALRSANNSLPVGSIQLDGVNYAVTFEGSIEDPSEIKDVAIFSKGGQPVYIRDIATVNDGVGNRNTEARVSLNGEPSRSAVSLSVFKRGGGDITTISDNVLDKLEELKSGLLSDVDYLVSFNTGEFVKDDLTTLSLSALQTIILVMIILFLALGWREAIIAGLAIPLSFLVAFIALDGSGNTINFVSLFSLILSVGILVDSAIVITEAIHTNMKEGGNKTEAARKAVNTFYSPLISGTATTIAVFAPLFLLSGVTGEFISSIPFTIIFVLLASLFVALAIVPLIASIFLRRRNMSKFEEGQERRAHKIEDTYRKFIGSIIGDRKKEKLFFTIITILFFVAVSFPFIGAVKVIFFPQEDIDFIFIDIEESQGSTLASTDLAVRQVEEVLYDFDVIDSFVTVIGGSSSFSGDTVIADEKLANITVLLDKDRKQRSTEILQEVRREMSKITSADVRVFEPNSGPPAGAPVYIKFFGDNLDDINNTVKKAETLLASIDGTSEINSSAKTDSTEFVLRIDRAKASQVGLSASQVAFFLRTAIFGTDATTINTPNEDIDVVVKMNLNDGQLDRPEDTVVTTIDTIKKLPIPTPSGSVLIGSLLDTNIDLSNTVISHEDRKRIGFVSSALSGERTAGEIVSEFNHRQGELDLPKGVEISFGGETEDVQQTFKEMGMALVLGVILILAILVLQFNSYRHAIYIVAILPLSLVGVLFGLSITGKPLSFPSIMGFIALAGIVVNNSIILIDVMNSQRLENPKKPVKDVVIDGAVSRLRPIVLTTLTTVIGIFPLTYASELWGPLAYSIMFGLSFSVVITLILVPILYNRKPGKVNGRDHSTQIN